MGSRDYRSRETKKPKKDAKKQLLTKVVVEESVEVEEVRKARRTPKEAEAKE
ncbi:MAG: hypothetical protein HYY02_13315 [Chloroflexi bacterium]|nr:hypothetical protein [Chloroflexota bacterium]